MCCDGKVTPRPNTTNVDCCGKVGYNKDTEKCCKGKVYYTFHKYKILDCCRDQIYDKNKARCCKGAVRSIKHLNEKEGHSML